MQEEEKLANVAPEEIFRTRAGGEIKNLKELMHVLGDISPDSFAHHVNSERNDFANWIRNSVKDAELADSLEQTTDFEETKRMVSDRIENLERSLEIKKIHQNLDELEASSVGLAEEIPKEQPAIEPVGERQPTPIVSEEEPKPATLQQHPFEYLKHNINHSLMMLTIGLVVGLVLGYLFGSFF